MDVPKYSQHKGTGQAYVKLNGKFHYLGKFGTEESRKKYEALIGKYLANGRSIPATIDKTSGITVGQLHATYLEHCREYYQRDGEPTQEYEAHVYLRNKIAPIADLPVNSVTPATIDDMRQKWIADGNTRSYINKTVGRIVRMYKWSVAKSLADVATWQRLTAISGLKAGRSKARETEGVKPVADAIIDAACESMPDDLSAMVKLHRLTGSRPGELWKMTPGDIDRTSDVWVYVPKSHKTQHHGKQRRIYLGPKAQEILLPYLLRPSTELCFSRESGKPWDRHSYLQAIQLACKNAGVPAFNPNQIRHTAGTEIRQMFGLESVQVALGHSNAAVSEIYAERDFKKAELIAREIG